MKILPPGMTFERALQSGYAGRLEDARYLLWVASLPCVCGCGGRGDAHHPYGVGFKGGATKVPDWWAIPMRRACHDALHRDVAGWEAEYGLQLQHALITLTQAVAGGVLKLTALARRAA